MRCRLVVAAVVLALLFGACAGKGAANPPSRPLSALQDELPARQTLVFLVDRTADTVFHDAAQLYAEKVLELTGGYLTVELRDSSDAAGEYARGAGDIVFLDSREQAGFCADFAFLSEPMRYTGYDAFTMGLNSREMLDTLNRDTRDNRNTLLLAAYYSGTNFFLSAQPVGGNRPSGDFDPYQEGEEPEIPVAALRSDNHAAALLYSLGMRAAVEPDMDRRLEILEGDERALAECSAGELGSRDWGDSGLNLVQSGHSMAPVWLAVGAGPYDAYPASYRAALQEAAAYLFPVIDNGLLLRESQAVAALREQGVSVETAYPALRAAADTIEQERAGWDPHARYLLGILKNMG